jgi:hypothetical protein
VTGKMKGMDFDDMFQEGVFGLAKAIELFDIAKGYSLSTYATIAIRSYVMRAIDINRTIVKVPITAHYEYRKGTRTDIPEEIILTTKGRVEQEVAELQEIIKQGKELSVEIKQYRNKRSLDANAYMWLLLGKMAAVLHTTKDELYLQMLDRYGVYTHIIVKPSVVDKVKQEWRTVRELGEVTVNGQKGVQLQCFFGSSTYDSKEFSILLDGVISECKEIGIEVISEEEKQLLIKEWGK